MTVCLKIAVSAYIQLISIVRLQTAAMRSSSRRSGWRITGPDKWRILRYGHVFPGLDLYCADPAQPLTTAGEELDDLDHDLSDLSVRGVKGIKFSLIHPPRHTGSKARVGIAGCCFSFAFYFWWY